MDKIPTPEIRKLASDLAVFVRKRKAGRGQMEEAVTAIEVVLRKCFDAGRELAKLASGEPVKASGVKKPTAPDDPSLSTQGHRHTTLAGPTGYVNPVTSHLDSTSSMDSKRKRLERVSWSYNDGEIHVWREAYTTTEEPHTWYSGNESIRLSLGEVSQLFAQILDPRARR